MDSLSQIVLGAACGELVAGKKIGNRAMIWGAFGGTIPDLDIIANFFTDEITALAFHRGIMHSALFAVLAPWPLAWLAQKIYNTDLYQNPIYKTVLSIMAIMALVGLCGGITAAPYLISGVVSWSATAIGAGLLGFGGYWLYRNYYSIPLSAAQMDYFPWVLLFFLSIFTHPILDCFTGYGTQLFAPFSDYRIQWATVFVVDPLYTLPFGLALLLAARLLRTNPYRAKWAWAGLIYSCLYLGFTVWHKSRVTEVFAKSLTEAGIPYTRFMSGPTPLNNIVWSCVAETDSMYYIGTWGFNDGTALASDFIPVPKNHELLQHIPNDDRVLNILKWFSNGYYNVVQGSDGALQLNDLRFGIMGERLEGPDSYVFRFHLNEKNNQLSATQTRNFDRIKGKDALSALWRRINF